MTREQKTVAIGAASGVSTMVLAVAGIYRLWPDTAGLTDVASRLAFTPKANALAAVPLLVGIITVGNNRFLSDSIDPTLHKEDAATEINGRCSTTRFSNTCCSWRHARPQRHADGRADQGRCRRRHRVLRHAICVLVGYRIHPLYRAFGMSSTIYLNVGILGTALWKTLWG